MGRPRKYGTNAEKQKAYRERKKRQQELRWAEWEKAALDSFDGSNLGVFKGPDPK